MRRINIFFAEQFYALSVCKMHIMLMYLLKEAKSTYLGGSLSEHDITASRKQVPGHVLQRRGWWWCCKLTTHQVSRLCGEGWTEPRSRQMADRRQLAPLLTTSTTPLQPHHYILLVLEYQEVKDSTNMGLYASK